MCAVRMSLSGLSMVLNLYNLHVDTCIYMYGTYVCVGFIDGSLLVNLPVDTYVYGTNYLFVGFIDGSQLVTIFFRLWVHEYVIYLGNTKISGYSGVALYRFSCMYMLYICVHI